jgi:hypothetical protein
VTSASISDKGTTLGLPMSERESFIRGESTAARPPPPVILLAAAMVLCTAISVDSTMLRDALEGDTSGSSAPLLPSASVQGKLITSLTCGGGLSLSSGDPTAPPTPAALVPVRLPPARAALACSYLAGRRLSTGGGDGAGAPLLVLLLLLREDAGTALRIFGVVAEPVVERAFAG